MTQPQWIGVDAFIGHGGRKPLDNTMSPVARALTYPCRTDVRLRWAQHCGIGMPPGSEEPQYVVWCACDQPLYPNLSFASKQKLAYAAHCPYLAENQLGSLLSQGVGPASAYGPSSLPHSILAGHTDRYPASRRWFSARTTRLSVGRNVRADLRLLKEGHVLLA